MEIVTVGAVIVGACLTALSYYLGWRSRPRPHRHAGDVQRAVAELLVDLTEQQKEAVQAFAHAHKRGWSHLARGIEAHPYLYPHTIDQLRRR